VADIFLEGNDRAQSRAGGYPAGILKAGSKTRKASQVSAHHRHRASPVAKKAGMDRKFNVGNLSARRAIGHMTRALGTKHGPQESRPTGSAQSTNRSSYQFTASGGTLATRFKHYGIYGQSDRDRYLVSAIT
jgi:hypothetical protein